MIFKIKWELPDKSIIKKRARILVIDNDDFPYKKLFERDDYSIDKWDDVKTLSDIDEEKYDILLLDIQGIGKEISKEEGLGVLKYIKETTPSQIVIAYSNANWSLKYQKFFDMADEILAKEADYTDFKKVVDKYLEMKFSYKYYLDKILSITDDKLSKKDMVKVYEKSLRFRSKKISENYLKKKGIDIEVIKTLGTIVQQAINIYTIIKGMG